MEILCKFYQKGKNKNPKNQFLIIYFYKTLYESIKKHHHNNIPQISSYEENMAQFGGNQYFYKKNKQGQKEIFQAEL